MMKLILLLSTTLLLLSATTSSKSLREMNDLIVHIHKIEGTTGKSCKESGDNIVCELEKDANVSKKDYNKSVLRIQDWNERFITKEMQAFGLKGKVIFKEL